MTVHALDENRLPVDIEQLALDLDRAEARLESCRPTGFLPIRSTNFNIVKVRCLGTPKIYIVKMRRAFKNLQAILDGGRFVQRQ